MEKNEFIADFMSRVWFDGLNLYQHFTHSVSMCKVQDMDEDGVRFSYDVIVVAENVLYQPQITFSIDCGPHSEFEGSDIKELWERMGSLSKELYFDIIVKAALEDYNLAPGIPGFVGHEYGVEHKFNLV